jgi:tellurite resistance protein TehA-like permease
MSDIIINFVNSLWNAMQMIFVYGLAGLLVISVIYFFYRLEQEVAKDKANK